MNEKRIKLIVTGDSEKKSLHTSLQKSFPPHTVDGDFVIWETPRKTDGATGYRLQANDPPSKSMCKLVDVMFAETLTIKKPNGVLPDLVVVVDDVELGNIGQEDVVAKTFQSAVKNKLSALQATYSASNFSRIKDRIQSSCSFHLLCPMVESYFFADAATLSLGGITAANFARLSHPTNVELFDASPDKNLKWQSLYINENDKKQINSAWWKTQCHPKRYLAHLLSESGMPEYQETTLGAKLIESTNWASIAKLNTDSPIISSFLEDLWDWFGKFPETGSFIGASSQVTYQVKITHQNQRVLRNI